MSKMFVFQIGWQHYTLDDPAASADLLALLMKLKRVKQKGYSGPYYLDSDQEPVCDNVTIRDVILEPAPADGAEPDVVPIEKPTEIPF